MIVFECFYRAAFQKPKMRDETLVSPENFEQPPSFVVFIRLPTKFGHNPITGPRVETCWHSQLRNYAIHLAPIVYISETL